MSKKQTKQSRRTQARKDAQHRAEAAARREARKAMMEYKRSPAGQQATREAQMRFYESYVRRLG